MKATFIAITTVLAGLASAQNGLPTCAAADKEIAVAYAQNICKTAGVTNLPTVVSCASTASATAPASTGSVSTNATITSGPTTTSGAAGNSSKTSTGSLSPTSATAPSNAGLQKEIGIGAGLVGGLAAMVALL
ncbi:hypothetical protein NHQ30_000242 [Ciborinia camelliae]|nr:hypothetical protein NHQ30_000242 [Ciborinia camelliae]